VTPARTARRRWDIFCTVVDNFGDIGVTWRLARQLVRELDQDVTLWVDDLESFARIEPTLNPDREYQQVGGVSVRRWHSSFPDVDPADVVVEAFACQLPERYVMRMTTRRIKTAWVNLEYLSAESWVEGTHRLPSPHPRLPLTKYFFFPGFTARTGGLLREADVFERRDAAQHPNERAAFWTRLGLVPPRRDELTISLFAYRNAGLPSLLAAWSAGSRPVRLLVPPGPALDQVRSALGGSALTLKREALTAHALPFMPQDDFDRLLALSDFNFVRGEDSFVRAQWAAQPFLWHIYPQAEDAHWPKLQAFLDIYTAFLEAETAARLRATWEAWNRGEDMTAAWAALAPVLPTLQTHARTWARDLTSQTDLARQLADFVDKLL
jgi:uncharacterized repeat protein (TIGR03837 family)